MRPAQPRPAFDQDTRLSEPIIPLFKVFMAEAVKSDQYAGALNTAGLDIAYLDGPDFATFWDAEIKRIEEAVRAIGRV